jgi:hypothetical protein
MMTNDSKDQGREAFEAWWESLPGATGVEADKDYEADVKGWALMSWQAALATSASALARDEASVLLPCPFCGSDAKSDNGFSPCESITYAWCGNQDCSLCTIEFGFTVEEWNHRAASKAGAALSEAAPDLFEALMAYHKAYDENPHLGPRGSAVDQAFIKARAAIEKATGAQ